MQNEAGLPLMGAAPELAYVVRDEQGGEQVRTVALAQGGPGLYEGSMPLPPPGAYRGVLRHVEGERDYETAAAFAVNYPAEWRPAADAQAGRAALVRWATLTGGGVTDWDLIGAAATPEQVESSTDGRLLQRLLLVALLWWPAEIAIRRRWLLWPQ